MAPTATAPPPANPIIAGQGPEYLYKQLSNFKAVDGKPAVRNNAIMGGMVAALSDEDMKSLAACFSQQKLKPSVAKDEKLLAEGQKLWRKGDFEKGVPACAGCHGPAGAGLPAQYPRLAGQYAEYTEAQLKTFRSHERNNDPEKMMRIFAANLSDTRSRLWRNTPPACAEPVSRRKAAAAAFPVFIPLGNTRRATL